MQQHHSNSLSRGHCKTQFMTSSCALQTSDLCLLVCHCSSPDQQEFERCLPAERLVVLNARDGNVKGLSPDQQGT